MIVVPPIRLQRRLLSSNVGSTTTTTTSTQLLRWILIVDLTTLLLCCCIYPSTAFLPPMTSRHRHYQQLPHNSRHSNNNQGGSGSGGNNNNNVRRWQSTWDGDGDGRNIIPATNLFLATQQANDTTTATWSTNASSSNETSDDCSEDGLSFSSSSSSNDDDDDDAVRLVARHTGPLPRGGGRLTKEKPSMKTSITTYWKNAIGSGVHAVTIPFVRVKQWTVTLFKNKEILQEEELMEQLRPMKVLRVTVPNTTVLPYDVVQIAAKRSGLIGNPLKTEFVQDMAQSIKRWYMLQGYALHSMTGVTLRPETATAEIAVQEPVNSIQPVGISFYKEMIVDPETGDLLTFRQYKERHQQRSKTFGLDGETTISKADLNMTYVPTRGTTKPNRLANIMGMIPGQPFQWDPVRWQKIATSGLFKRILHVAPQPMGNNTVQMHIVVAEAPSKHLEYGVGKSLYSGGWEGELDFEHVNLYGGGEILGVNVRRGTTEAIPSVRVKFSNGRLGLEGGYDVEAFSEVITNDEQKPQNNEKDSSSNKKKKDKKIIVVDAVKQNEDETAIDATLVAATTSAHIAVDDDDATAKEAAATTPTTTTIQSYETDVLVSRRGATFRVKNPIDTRTIQHSMASASVERTATKTGLHETIGSMTVDVGPFYKQLPMDARSNIDATFTTGARLGQDAFNLFHHIPHLRDRMFHRRDGQEEEDTDETVHVSAPFEATSSSFSNIVPYVSVSATTRQLFPLVPTTTSSSRRSTAAARIQQQQNKKPQRPVLLALRHSITASTNSVPRHVAMAIGTSSSIRGSTPNGQLSSVVRGTTELRVPIQLPARLQMGPDDATLVIYGDWLLGVKDTFSSFIRKSSAGIGLRKNIQGFPLQYDVTYSNEGKIKAMFGFGSDFMF